MAYQKFITKEIRQELANQIYDILIEFAGVVVDYLAPRDSFVRWFVEDSRYSKEFRFQGSLGFGGKFWRNNDRLYVNCYSEDETPERMRVIERVNDALSSLNTTEV